MDFLINNNELGALYGLSHIQQLAYLRAIRPHMDVKTGLVGVKRRISYQSISEQLFVEPHPGIKTTPIYSRAQLRRAIAGLERAGLICLQSEGLQLILKCQLATLGYFVQNKAVTNPSQQDIPSESSYQHVNKGLSKVSAEKAAIGKLQKAGLPLEEDNYIYLFTQFEKFWDLYPLKKSKQKAWEAFRALNPANDLPTQMQLAQQIQSALQNQIQFYEQQRNQGQWVASWKYPANWLAHKCWEDEIQNDVNQEKNNAVHETSFKQQPVTDNFWESCKSGIEEQADNNIIDLSAYRGTSKAH